VGNEQAQPTLSILDTTQTDSESVPLENENTAAKTHNPEAFKEPAGTQPSFADHTLTGVAASEDQGSVKPAGAPSTEQKKEEPSQEAPKSTPKPNTGEKRDIDSSTAPISRDKDSPVVEKPDEPEVKKQKTEPETEIEPVKEPVKDHAVVTNGTATTPATGETNVEPKKAARSKKEKVKEAVQNIIPGDGIGSRTRSRTKPT
jgi:hypothetical protein